ncbi:PREDICTED: protein DETOXIFICATION 23-like [Lupinus angustifolius]|uniref:protein DETOXIFICATION 23-like n=1 Tax=Lupinus angustifolius TaxID=3871 RepID=UPI00092F2ADF|nr:PREDICTED: protein DETOXIFICATION 23-like [Lupinus angustifolius]
MASALSTLCGQAYGTKEYRMMGVYLRRSWIVLFLTEFILIPLFIFRRPILILIPFFIFKDLVVCPIIIFISLWSIPIMFAFIVSFTCQTFLQSQSKNVIIAFLAVFSIIFHLCLSWLLVIKLNLVLPSAMVATSLEYWIPNIGQHIFVTRGWCHEKWKVFSFLAFRELWPVVKLSLSAGAMLCLELWYNAILALLTGNMKNSEVEIDSVSICVEENVEVEELSSQMEGIHSTPNITQKTKPSSGDLNLVLPSAMVATSLEYWIPNIGQHIFVTRGWCHEKWKVFSFLAFRELWPVVKLSLSAGAMLCLELWYNAILALLTGNMKNSEVEIDSVSICVEENVEVEEVKHQGSKLLTKH